MSLGQKLRKKLRKSWEKIQKLKRTLKEILALKSQKKILISQMKALKLEKNNQICNQIKIQANRKRTIRKNQIK